MTSCLPAFLVADDLRDAGHTDSTTGLAWRPGYRVTQASPRTIRLWHDGPDEQQHLDQYARATPQGLLRDHGDPEGDAAEGEGHTAVKSDTTASSVLSVRKASAQVERPGHCVPLGPSGKHLNN